MKRQMTLLMSVGFVLLAYSQAQASCGTVEVAKGDVKIEGGGKSVVAKVGAKICAGQTIVSGADSRAKLKMEDGNELNISPNSSIVLEQYQFNAAENKKKVLLNVLRGKVRATTKEENMYVDKAKDGQANTFQVKTKSAVAGVRGTDFLTGYDPSTQKSEIVTFRGKVDVGQPGANGTILNPVSVKAGQQTSQAPGQVAAPPRAVPPADLQKMNTETKADTASVNKDTSSSNTTAKKDDAKKDDTNAAAPAAASDDKKSDSKSDTKTDAKSDSKSAAPAAANDSTTANSSDSSSGDKKSAAPTASTSDSKSAASTTSSTASGDKSGSGTSPTAGSSTSGAANSASDTGRAPASVSPNAPTTATPTSNLGSMVDHNDLGTSAGKGQVNLPPPTIVTPPQLVLLPLPSAAPVVNVPTCAFCNSAIQSGNTNLKVNVHY